MSGRRSDPYYRNNAKAAVELHSAGHRSARTEDWAGGTEGVVVPLETGHQVEIGQSPDHRDGTWNMRVLRHPDDPGYSQDGIKLGDPGRGARIPSRSKEPVYDDHYSSTVVAHPRELPGHVAAFVNHPQVRKAIGDDMAKMKAERATRGGNPRPLSGDQFGSPRRPMD